MEPVIYEIVFAGNALPGFDVNKVKDNFARLFRADDKKLAALFSGRSVTLKKTDDKAVAVKFLQTLQKAGADVKARRARSAAKPSARAPNIPKPTPQQVTKGSTSAGPVTPQKAKKTETIASLQFDFQQQISAPDFELCALQKTTRASFLSADENQAEQASDIKAPNFPLAPVGSPVLEHPLPAPEPVQVDISHMVLGQMDDLPLAPTQPEAVPVQAPELEVSASNAGSFADQVPAQAYNGPVPSTDQLSMALPGSDIIETEFKKLPVIVAADLGESLNLVN